MHYGGFNSARFSSWQGQSISSCHQKQTLSWHSGTPTINKRHTLCSDVSHQDSEAEKPGTSFRYLQVIFIDVEVAIREHRGASESPAGHDILVWQHSSGKCTQSNGFVNSGPLLEST